MRRQRPPGFPEAIDAVAENLPFSDGAFDASMATFTVHQWQNLKAGLREMRRVTRGPIVILTCDPRRVQKFWLNDYAPEVLATEARRYPAMNTMAEALCGSLETLPVPIPLLCRDGFNEAYYGRPEMLLDPAARTSCSAWSFVAEPIETIYVQNLRTALEDGSWDSKHGVLRCSPEYTGSLVLLVSRP